MTALLEAGSSAAYVYDYKATRRRLLGDLGKCSKNMRMLKMMKMKTQIEKGITNESKGLCGFVPSAGRLVSDARKRYDHQCHYAKGGSARKVEASISRVSS